MTKKFVLALLFLGLVALAKCSECEDSETLFTCARVEADGANDALVGVNAAAQAKRLLEKKEEEPTEENKGDVEKKEAPATEKKAVEPKEVNVNKEEAKAPENPQKKEEVAAKQETEAPKAEVEKSPKEGEPKNEAESPKTEETPEKQVDTPEKETIPVEKPTEKPVVPSPSKSDIIDKEQVPVVPEEPKQNITPTEKPATSDENKAPVAIGTKTGKFEYIIPSKTYATICVPKATFTQKSALSACEKQLEACEALGQCPRADKLISTKKLHTLSDEPEEVGGAVKVIAVMVCFSIVISVIGVLALSSYYKREFEEKKQAPFNPPSWAPRSLFPRNPFYYEQELVRPIVE